MNAPRPASLNLELPAWPDVDFAQFGEVEKVPLSRIQTLTSAYMSRNSVVIPHVTHQDEIDITDVDLRRKTMVSPGGNRLTLLPLLMKAVVEQLRVYPRFNASLDAGGQQLVLKKYFHIGVAIETPAGLLVAVVRDCDRKSAGELADEVSELSSRAREKGLPMKDMVGGCMTISSLGHIGGVGFTPIINAPEVAILGVTRARWQPSRGEDDSVQWRLMLPVSLSYDHRVINGADAARFTAGLGSQPDKASGV